MERRVIYIPICVASFEYSYLVIAVEAHQMWRQIAGQPSDALTRPDDDEEEEPLASHFNTNNFGNFLDVSSTAI